MEDQSVRDMITRIPAEGFANSGPPPVKGEPAAQALSKHFAPWVEPPSPAEVRQMAEAMVADALKRAPAPEARAPGHYQLLNGSDIYDVEIEVFGHQAWETHALQSVFEYVARAYKKDGVVPNVRKAMVILQRILDEQDARP